MSPQAQFNKLAQSIYLAMRGRYFDDLTSDDGLIYLDQVADWADQFLDELETMTDEEDNPIDWKWSRQLNYNLGNAKEGVDTLSINSSINYLIANPSRPVYIVKDGSTVSRWIPAQPSDMDTSSGTPSPDMVSLINGALVFSRAFNANEDGGTVYGDVSASLPRPAKNNMNILKLVKPRQLLILGIAKNATLPDIVRGGLAPSYVQKYNDLIKSAIIRNNTSGVSPMVPREDYGHISGVGF